MAVGGMMHAKRKSLKHSSLEKIEGIGPKKAKALLSHFSTLQNLQKADFEALKRVKGISDTDALHIIQYFKNKNQS